ncbi:hypothetical protein [Nocardiopsis potens]|uniref:hypothetical protein n=1 Tax=Nocardiopsis potens TaxID=1246458 RepID=UPI00034A0477|nr:hypothetical protein [Nocardiopsis potens]
MIRAEPVRSLPGVPHRVVHGPQPLQWGLAVDSAPASLDVYDLGTGERVRSFPRPVPLGPKEGPQEAIAPDLSYAVLIDAEAVRAVEPGGRVRWSLPVGRLHGDIAGCAAAHATADGAVVWAQIGEDGDAPADEHGWRPDRTVALAADDGRLLAQAVYYSNQFPLLFPHPDGVHMLFDQSEWCGALRVGPDGAAEITDLSGGTMLHIAAPAPDGSLLMFLEAMWTLERRSLPDLRRLALMDDDVLGGGSLAGPPGFLDADRVLAAVDEPDVLTAGENGAPFQHLLLNAADLSRIGPIAYPDGTPGEPAVWTKPLGDGTWLTSPDDEDLPVRRWRLAPRR